MSTQIDILHRVPRFWLDSQSLRQALTFAFATGGGGDAFSRVYGKAKAAESEHNPACFAQDLFLDTFVERCLDTAPIAGGRSYQTEALKRIISHPPKDRTDVCLRQEVFRELASRPDLRLSCDRVWKTIDTLRLALESAELGKRSNPIARRLEILRHIAALPEVLESGFRESSSALGRIAEFARNARQSTAFEHLHNLVDHDNHLATVDIRVRVGRDGQVRHLDIVQMSENASSPHHRNPWLRFWSRAVALLRGYSLYDREVLGRLVETVFDGVVPFISGIFQLSLQLEFYLSFSGLTRRANSVGLAMCVPTFHSANEQTETLYTQLFNPFLLLDGQVPVPCDLRVGDARLILLTGPNSGGKTRLLQSLGLAQLLAQTGAPIPAKSARLRWRSGMFVSLVHEVSADQREGRLGTELLRIRRLFERIGYHDLVLLDELCSGTNPSEGEEIVELVIALLNQLQPQAWISTHFLQFAARLQLAPPVSSLDFLQVELDPRQRPLYSFAQGVATTSLAAKTAERLGVTRDALESLIVEKRTSLVPSAERASER